MEKMTFLATPLGQILLEERLISDRDLQRALERQHATGERIGEALVALGAVNRADVLRALARQQGVPYLSREEFPSTLPVLQRVSPKYMRQYRFCPLSVETGTLTIATADPVNPLVSDDLRQTLGL